MCIWGVIIYSAGICECWPTYQWTNASASVCNEAVLCYKTFPCSKYFLFYSITDIFDNKINNLALWYINFIAQHFSVRLRTSGMWTIAIVKNNNHKSMQHYCITQCSWTVTLRKKNFYTQNQSQQVSVTIVHWYLIILKCFAWRFLS